MGADANTRTPANELRAWVTSRDEHPAHGTPARRGQPTLSFVRLRVHAACAWATFVIGRKRANAVFKEMF